MIPLEPLAAETSDSHRECPKHIARISWLAAVSPAVLFFCLATLGLHVRLGLGHWPEPMVGSYKSGAFSLHQLVALGWFYFAAFAAAPLWFSMLLFKARDPWPVRPMVASLQVAVFAIASLLIVALFELDPFRFTTWLLD